MGDLKSHLPFASDLTFFGLISADLPQTGERLYTDYQYIKIHLLRNLPFFTPLPYGDEGTGQDKEKWGNVYILGGTQTFT